MEMQKPFSMDLNYAKLIEEGETERKERQEADKMTKPFTMDLDYAKSQDKLYLVLLVFNHNYDGGEDTRDFEFIHGRQFTYDRLKQLLTDPNADEQLDAMKSLVFVDSPKIRISNKLNVYTFMKDMKFSDKIVDESSFDIQDYYYELEENDEE